MKQTLAPSVAPSAGSIGGTPAARLTAMATGTIMSPPQCSTSTPREPPQMREDSRQRERRMGRRAGRHGLPIESASPVVNASDPIASPPPKSRTVPSRF